MRLLPLITLVLWVNCADSAEPAGATDDVFPRIRAAQQRADAVAPQDDVAWLNAYWKALAAEEREARAGGQEDEIGAATAPYFISATTQPTTDAAAPGPLDRDPEYARNLRELVRRAVDGRMRTTVRNGIEDAAGRFPECVSVGSGREPHHFRGSGTLIAPNVVLTAAHNSRLGFDKFIFVGLKVTEPANGRIYEVKQSIEHELYNSATHFNDICLLVLKEDVADVKPRKLATAEQIAAAMAHGTAAPAAPLLLAGYGTNDASGRAGLGTRRLAAVGFRSACDAADAEMYKCNIGMEFANGENADRTTCAGDSGGPSYISDGQGGWVVMGVTSRPLPAPLREGAVCSGGGINERADRYAEWIRENVPDARWAE